MLRIAMPVVAILFIAAAVSTAEAAYCGGRTLDVSAARSRWAVARQASADPAHHDEVCRAYGTQFFEAVTARQSASSCEDDDKRQQTLEILDAEIDAFNNLIAARCSGS
jgi:hypothetical protein